MGNLNTGRVLLLFDIDGTLIETGGAGMASLESGFFDAFPEHRGSSFPGLDLGGATDGSVAMFVFANFGIADIPENRSRYFECYLAHLGSRLVKFFAEGKGRVLPGVRELLGHLATCEEFELALLTGNIAEGAWMKLRHYELDSYFSWGAFGCDHPDRNALGPIARERARQNSGHDFPPERIIVIGDTPKDISCARALGGRVVAVATGGHSRAELEQAAPDILLDNLMDHEDLIRGITSLLGGTSSQIVSTPAEV